MAIGLAICACCRYVGCRRSVCCQISRELTKPCKGWFTGLGMWRGGERGWVWPVGVTVCTRRRCVGRRCSVLLSVVEIKKKPRKCWFTGLPSRCGGDREVAWLLVWPVGCVADV